MERHPLVHVVILYVHPLLGEGLARLLSAEPGIAVTAVRGDDATGAAVALAAQPDVIVEERGDGASPSTRLGTGFPPLRLLVGINGASGAGENERMTVDPELIVRAVRALKRRRMSLVTA